MKNICVYVETTFKKIQNLKLPMILKNLTQTILNLSATFALEKIVFGIVLLVNTISVKVVEMKKWVISNPHKKNNVIRVIN